MATAIKYRSVPNDFRRGIAGLTTQDSEADLRADLTLICDDCNGFTPDHVRTGNVMASFRGDGTAGLIRVANLCKEFGIDFILNPLEANDDVIGNFELLSNAELFDAGEAAATALTPAATTTGKGKLLQVEFTNEQDLKVDNIRDNNDDAAALVALEEYKRVFRNWRSGFKSILPNVKIGAGPTAKTVGWAAVEWGKAMLTMIRAGDLDPILGFNHYGGKDSFKRGVDGWKLKETTLAKAQKYLLQIGATDEDGIVFAISESNLQEPTFASRTERNAFLALWLNDLSGAYPLVRHVRLFSHKPPGGTPTTNYKLLPGTPQATEIRRWMRS